MCALLHSDKSSFVIIFQIRLLFYFHFVVVVAAAVFGFSPMMMRFPSEFQSFVCVKSLVFVCLFSLIGEIVDSRYSLLLCCCYCFYCIANCFYFHIPLYKIVSHRAIDPRKKSAFHLNTNKNFFTFRFHCKRHMIAQFFISYFFYCNSKKTHTHTPHDIHVEDEGLLPSLLIFNLKWINLYWKHWKGNLVWTVNTHRFL